MTDLSADGLSLLVRVAMRRGAGNPALLQWIDRTRAAIGRSDVDSEELAGLLTRSLAQRGSPNRRDADVPAPRRG